MTLLDPSLLNSKASTQSKQCCLPTKRCVSEHSLPPRCEEASRLGRDSAIETLSLSCLTGGGSRSRNEIRAELEEKLAEIEQVNKNIDEDEDTNDK